jgi:hypothetical protein
VFVHGKFLRKIPFEAILISGVLCLRDVLFCSFSMVWAVA